jgi:hypothetical protein
MNRACSTNGEDGCKDKGKSPLGRTRCRWVDTIMIDLGQIGGGSIEWICLAQSRGKPRALLNAVMNLGGSRVSAQPVAPKKLELGISVSIFSD